MYSEENRLNLLALHGVADGVSELGEVGDHGAGLFLGTVLPERNKVIVLAVEKKSDVRGISGKIISFSLFSQQVILYKIFRFIHVFAYFS